LTWFSTGELGPSRSMSSNPSPQSTEGPKLYKLLDGERNIYRSVKPGQLGGYRPGRIYGKLNCPSARRALARGTYAKHRVFFADEVTAIAAGFRPCAKCLPDRYRFWKMEPRKWLFAVVQSKTQSNTRSE
jgi:hypothetical protein